MGNTPRQLRLFLIRHGETVDNVAQLYAGSRDSELTNHGYQQATRLGQHFQALGVTFTRIFASHLQRASKTAGKIREAQMASSALAATAQGAPEVVQVPLIMEQDFGFYEGKKWYERSADSKLTGKDQHRQEDTEGFVDVESKESMAQRVDTFLDHHLLPLLESAAPTDSKDHVVAIVSHGIILSVLWKRFLLRLPQKSVSFSPHLLADTRGFSLEHLGGWSNTGYLELHMQKKLTQAAASGADLAPPPTSESAPAADVDAQGEADGGIQGTPHSVSKEAISNERAAADHAVQPTPSITTVPSPKVAHGWLTMIETVNGRDHLVGLKRTGGGVGSARHDASQKNIDSFFKRRKIE